MADESAGMIQVQVVEGRLMRMTLDDQAGRVRLELRHRRQTMTLVGERSMMPSLAPSDVGREVVVTIAKGEAVDVLIRA